MASTHKRWRYLACIVVNIPLGLATRRYGNQLPALIANYGGDALYATLIFFTLRFLFIHASLWKVAAVAYSICVLIELQQLYREPWAVAFRNNNPIAGLILGHGFLWSDLVCYAVGVALGWVIAAFSENGNKGYKAGRNAPATN
jgi:hypothetical protein